LLVEIWRCQRPFRGQVSGITRAILDHHVFAKPYFESAGLILALDNSGDQPRPLGFVHAGFTANEDLSDLDKSIGVISQLKVTPGEHEPTVANELLKRACEYLKSNGAVEVWGGARFPHSPFYLGLYGGSQVPGIVVEDESTVKAFHQFGFEDQDQIVIMDRKLSGFRAIVDRQQMALRRQYVIHAVADPLEKSWWESCTLGMAERDRFSVCHKSNQQECGHVSYWDIQPLANHWGVLARGMYGLRVSEDQRRSGIATFLIGESLRHLMQQGIGLVEAQCRESDEAAIGVFRKLGFAQVSQGLLMSMKL
jgi:ribosomal protein S18 acetylase RimI-like enzyme